MEERDDRGRKTAKRDDDGREKDKPQLLSLQQQWERERETHGPIVIHKEEGGRGENFIVTAQPRPNQLTSREHAISMITKIFSTEFVRLFAICDELLNVHMPHARQ